MFIYGHAPRYNAMLVYAIAAARPSVFHQRPATPEYRHVEVAACRLPTLPPARPFVHSRPPHATTFLSPCRSVVETLITPDTRPPMILFESTLSLMSIRQRARRAMPLARRQQVETSGMRAMMMSAHVHCLP